MGIALAHVDVVGGKMAFRDRNQGFGFVYVDVKRLLEQTDSIVKNPEIHPQEKTAYSIHMPKKSNPSPTSAPAPITDIRTQSASVKPPVDARIAQIKENLDRLQTLHHKLHAVLDELSNVSKSKKKSSEET